MVKVSNNDVTPINKKKYISETHNQLNTEANLTDSEDFKNVPRFNNNTNNNINDYDNHNDNDQESGNFLSFLNNSNNAAANGIHSNANSIVSSNKNFEMIINRRENEKRDKIEKSYKLAEEAINLKLFIPYFTCAVDTENIKRVFNACSHILSKEHLEKAGVL